MRNFIFGAIAGLVLGILGTRLALSPDHVLRSAATGESAVIGSDRAAAQSQVGSASPPKGKTLTTRAPQGSSQVTRDSLGQIGQLNLPRLSNTQSPDRTEAPAGTQAITLTSAHRDFLTPTPQNKGAPLEMHRTVEAQARDDSWASYMEQLLNGFFAPRAPRVGVEIANIACRESLCEIQAFSSERASVAFGTLLSAAEKEPWWDFTHVQALSGTSQNREVVIVFLDRSKSPAQQAPSKAI